VIVVLLSVDPESVAYCFTKTGWLWHDWGETCTWTEAHNVSYIAMKLVIAFNSIFSSWGVRRCQFLCSWRILATWWTHLVENCRVSTLAGITSWYQWIQYINRSNLLTIPVSFALGLHEGPKTLRKQLYSLSLMVEGGSGHFGGQWARITSQGVINGSRCLVDG